MKLEELAAWIGWDLLGDHEDSTTASSGGSSSEEEETEDEFYTCDAFSSDEEASALSEDSHLCTVAGRWTVAYGRGSSLGHYCRVRTDRLDGIVFQAWVDLWEERIRSENDANLRSLEP